MADDIVARVLRCALDEPPAGGPRWTTRAIADASGVSQATVSRIRKRRFPRADQAVAILPKTATAVLACVDTGPAGTALGFHASTDAVVHHAPISAARTDVVETIVCAALGRRQAGPAAAVDYRAADGDSLAVLHRAAAQLPTGVAATLIIDVPLNVRADQWLRTRPELTVRSVTGENWFALVHQIAAVLDPGQEAELRDVQRRIRLALRTGSPHDFTWSRQNAAVPSLTRRPRPIDAEQPTGVLTAVVQGLCAAIMAGELAAGDPVSTRQVGLKSGVPRGRAAHALAQLAEEGLVERHAGRWRLPVPTRDDVVEIFTARGLLGTAVVRRIASSGIDVSAVADEYYPKILRCDEHGAAPECGSLDLELQDELARAAGMPRISTPFIRLTLHVRMFVAILGVNHRCPTTEIVVDDGRILAELRRGDPETAVEAWRRKIDNCARHLLTHVGGTGEHPHFAGTAGVTERRSAAAY